MNIISIRKHGDTITLGVGGGHVTLTIEEAQELRRLLSEAIVSPTSPGYLLCRGTMDLTATQDLTASVDLKPHPTDDAAERRISAWAKQARP